MITHITPRETELARQIDEQGGQLVEWRDRALAAEVEIARMRAAQGKPLTNEQISAASKGHMTRNGFARAIEAKLKEKNT
jgi:hypothetical protein